MKYGLYCIKDEKVGFLQVMQDTNDAAAIRNFKFMCSRSENLSNFMPSDFSFYKIGEFDSATAEVVLESTPKMICNAAQLVEV